MKRFLILLLILLLFPLSFAESDYTYFAMQGGGIRITGYRGKGGALEVPEKIDGKPVISIGENAFEGKNVSVLILPGSVSDIGMAAFRNCKNLISVILTSEKDLNIGNYAFSGCSALETVYFAGDIHGLSIGSHAFHNCRSLTGFYLPDSLASLNVSETAFLGADALSPDAWNIMPVSRDMSVIIIANNDGNNHVGSNWSWEYYVNGRQVDTYSHVTLKPGNTITIKTIFTENDKIPDIGVTTKKYTVTSEDLAKGFTLQFDVNVTENGGRYSGSVCTWHILVHIC